MSDPLLPDAIELHDPNRRISGTFYYNDFQQFGQGDATFKLHVKGVSVRLPLLDNKT